MELLTVTTFLLVLCLVVMAVYGYDKLGAIMAVGEKTLAALEELNDAIDEVAGELEELANGEGVADEATAEAIRERAKRLRDLRPDKVEGTEPEQPVVVDPIPTDDGSGIVPNPLDPPAAFGPGDVESEAEVEAELDDNKE